MNDAADPQPTSPTIDQINRHATVRSYRSDPVAPALIEAIVAAGQRAATSSNLQMTSVVAVADAEKRQALAELCGGQAHIAQAPYFLAWCADRARLDRACSLRGQTQDTEFIESFLVAAVDVGIAMQNATLAAESLGLGSCYIGAIRNRPQEVIDLLELPELVVPIAGMTVGWPDAEATIRPRLALEAVLHWERYDNSNLDGLLAEYDAAMIATDIYAGRQVQVPGRPGEMEEYGWTEHSARRVSQPNRPHLSGVIKGQGYGLR